MSVPHDTWLPIVAKLLQAFGIVLSVAGIVGAARLEEWELRIRTTISHYPHFKWVWNTYASFARRQIAHYHEFLRENLAKVIVSAIIVMGFVSVIGAWLELESLPKPEPRLDPNTANFVGTICMTSIYGVFLIVLIIAIWQYRSETNSLIEAVFGLVGALVVQLLLLLLLTANLVLFVAVTGALIMGILVASLVTLILMPLLLITKIGLLPYQFLDLVSSRLKLQSTVLLLGILCELIGVLLS
ncbi:MAG: hypothetical protein WBW48_11095 [Anaerolineae bacterium]